MTTEAVEPRSRLRHVGEQLVGGPAAAGVNGRVEQLGGGRHAVFGRLHDDGIIDAVLRIDPVIGRELQVGAERDQQAVGDVLLREPELIGAGAVHVEAQLGRVHDLVHVHVHRPRNARQARGDLLGQRVIGWRIGQRPDHLHVDGGGQAEIQDLAHDIGRLKEKGQVGKLAVQALAQLADVVPGGGVVSGFSETRISPSNEPMVAVSLKRDVVAAVRQADIIEDVGQFGGGNSAGGWCPPRA